MHLKRGRTRVGFTLPICLVEDRQSVYGNWNSRVTGITISILNISLSLFLFRIPCCWNCALVHCSRHFAFDPIQVSIYAVVGDELFTKQLSWRVWSATAILNTGASLLLLMRFQLIERFPMEYQFYTRPWHIQISYVFLICSGPDNSLQLNWRGGGDEQSPTILSTSSSSCNPKSRTSILMGSGSVSVDL